MAAKRIGLTADMQMEVSAAAKNKLRNSFTTKSAKAILTPRGKKEAEPLQTICEFNKTTNLRTRSPVLKTMRANAFGFIGQKKGTISVTRGDMALSSSKLVVVNDITRKFR